MQARDLEKDKARLEELLEQDTIDDPHELMSIACYAVNTAVKAEAEVDRLYNELNILQEQLNNRH